MSNIQSRHKQIHFNEVAHVIGAALRAWPSAIEVRTGHLSIETYARKLREAVQAKKLHNWPTSEFPDALFIAHASELQTSMTADGRLLYGSKDAIANHKVIAQGTAAIEDQLTATEYLVDFGPDSSLLETFCLMLHKRVFTPAPDFILTGITSQQTELLEARYNIGFVPVDGQPNKWRIIT